MPRTQRYPKIRDSIKTILDEDFDLSYPDEYVIHSIQVKLSLDMYGSVFFTYDVSGIGSPHVNIAAFRGQAKYAIKVPLKALFNADGSSYYSTGVHNITSVNSIHGIEFLSSNSQLWFRVYPNAKSSKWRKSSKWIHLLHGHEFRIWSTLDIIPVYFEPVEYSGVLPTLEDAENI